MEENMHLTHLIGTTQNTQAMSDCCRRCTRRAPLWKSAGNGTRRPSTTASYPIAKQSPPTTSARRTTTTRKTNQKSTPKTFPSLKSTPKRYSAAEAGPARKNCCPSETPTFCDTAAQRSSRRRANCTAPSISSKTATTGECARSTRCPARCSTLPPSKTIST